MAAQRVQNYLKKHKIGPLFESLMARVIQDTPDDPIGYIIKILQGIHKKQSKQLENSFNGQISSRPPSRHSTLSQSENRGSEKRSNHLAASWSPGVVQQERRKQSHENQLRTTWSSNNNQEAPQPQPSWNNDTRVPTHDFDELFQMQHGDPKASPTQPLDKYQGVRSWDAEQKSAVEQRITFEPSDNDEINRELRLGKSLSAQAVGTPASSGSCPIKSRRAVEKHRQELQALLLEDSSPGQRRTGGGKHSPEENGTEIFERKEDLQEEGVATSHSRTGAKLNKLKRSENKEVSVTICARCARIIGNNDNEDIMSQASSDFNGRLFDDITTKQDLDKFESASEASGYVSTREKNTWNMPTDSEYESSPRHNTRTLKNVDGFSRKEPKHMYKSRDTDDSPVPTHRSTARSRNTHFDDTPRGFSNPTRNAWRMDDDISDNESDNADHMAQRRSSSQAADNNGRAWFPRGSGNNNSDDESTLTRD